MPVFKERISHTVTMLLLTILPFLLPVLSMVYKVYSYVNFFALITIYVIYRFLKPKNVVKNLSDIGYDHLLTGPNGKIKNKERREYIVNEYRKRRFVGNIPPVYPNGWYALAHADEVRKGEVKHVAALGEEFAIFRDTSGNVNVVDAISPHLGSNLGIGGTVNGDCIVCPFHGWKFNGSDGKCVSIPYTENIPAGAKVKCWPSCEVNTMIYVWYHAEDEEPSWYPEVIPSIHKGLWKYGGRREYTLNVHIEDIMKNDADPTHLPMCHGAVLFSGGKLLNMKKWWPKILRYNFFNHFWSVQQEEGKGHISSATFTVQLLFFSLFGCFNTNVKNVQYGPGYMIVNTHLKLGSTITIITMTPVEPLLVKVGLKFFYPYTLLLYGPFFCFMESKMVERDIPIWNHKRYADKPLLPDEDENVEGYRRWYRQFYSKNSFKYQQNTLREY